MLIGSGKKRERRRPQVVEEVVLLLETILPRTQGLQQLFRILPKPLHTSLLTSDF
jgi:hypothetical protein